MTTRRRHTQSRSSAATRATRNKRRSIPTPQVRTQEGWKIIHVAGTPQERGFTHGFLLHQELARIQEKFPFIVNEELRYPYKKYLATCRRTITPILKTEYPEFYQEIQAISEGAKQAGTDIHMDVLVAWNALMSMYEYLHPTPKRRERSGRCSAFIATGKATRDGEIVMGHTTHTDLVSGAFFHIIMYVRPHRGVPFCMQTAADASPAAPIGSSRRRVSWAARPPLPTSITGRHFPRDMPRISAGYVTPCSTENPWMIMLRS